MTNKFTAIWEICRPALKQHNATLHVQAGRYWLHVPIDPAIAPHILSHPAIVADADDQRCFRWRTSSVLRKFSTGALQ